MFVNLMTVEIRPLTVITLSTYESLGKIRIWWSSEGSLLCLRAELNRGNFVACRKGTKGYPILVLCVEVLTFNIYK